MQSKKHQGHHARKRFGQNFLQDQYIIHRIIDAIAPDTAHTMVEIGPGLGALTEPACEGIEKLHVVELDRDLIERLENHPTLQHKLIIHPGDALKFDFSTLIEADKKMKLFGNLPYNISTPLMFHLFDYAKHISSMHFMLQKEVVLRLSAAPNNKNYGRLSVMTQYFCQVIPILEVPPSAFVPAPKVESGVVCLIPHQDHPHPCASLPHLQRVTTTAFHMRRKTLRNNLKKWIDDETFERLEINPELRPEQIRVDQYVALADAWFEQDQANELK